MGGFHGAIPQPCTANITIHTPTSPAPALTRTSYCPHRPRGICIPIHCQILYPWYVSLPALTQTSYCPHTPRGIPIYCQVLYPWYLSLPPWYIFFLTNHDT